MEVRCTQKKKKKKKTSAQDESVGKHAFLSFVTAEKITSRLQNK